MCIGQEDRDVEEKVELVLEKMWKFNQTYKLSTEKLTDEEREPLWYIMDEFGSSVRHNDKPTIQCSIFYYIPTKTVYSILYPLQELSEGGLFYYIYTACPSFISNLISIFHFKVEITRDYLYGIKDEKLRRAKMTPWTDIDYEDESYEPLDENPTVQNEPGADYFNVT
jgi:tubulin--tyrosine ligase-like protein 12